MEEIKVTEKAILIRINNAYSKDMSRFQLYEYTRGRWRVDREKASQAEYAFSIFKGIVKEVYRIEHWYPCGDILSLIIEDNNEYGKEKAHYGKRSEFIGRLAAEPIRTRYVGKSVAHYFKVGAANPVQYVNL